MRPSKVPMLLWSVSLLAVAGASYGTPVVNEGAVQRRAELREALQRRNPPQPDNVAASSGEHQLTPEARAELRRQLRAQPKSP